MANYLLLYSGGGMPETPEEQVAVTKAWTDWFGSLGAAVVDGGNPFTPAAKHVGANGHIGDGPLGSPASGYSIVQADSLGAAVTIAQGCPIVKTGGQITVYETFNAMG